MDACSQCGSREIARDVSVAVGESALRLTKRVALHDWAIANLIPEVCTTCGHVEFRATASSESLKPLLKPTFVPRLHDHWLGLKRELWLYLLALVIAGLLIWLAISFT